MAAAKYTKAGFTCKLRERVLSLPLSSTTRVQPLTPESNACKAEAGSHGRTNKCELEDEIIKNFNNY